jgi:hypothetical protein
MAGVNVTTLLPSPKLAMGIVDSEPRPGTAEIILFHLD